MEKQAKTVSISLAIAMMFVTVFAIVFATFSWYYQERHAEVTSITMTAANSKGIQLSGNGLDWKTVLTTTSVPPDINLDSDTKFDSISTSGEVVDGAIKFYTGFYGDNGFETALITTEELYYTFDIYVLNGEPTVKMLTLGYDSAVVDTNNRDVSLSTRVAFISLGHSDTALGAITLDGTGVTSIDYIWEPNSTERNSKIDLYHNTYLAEGKSLYQGVNMAATDLALQNSLVVDDEFTLEQETKDVITSDPIAAGEDDSILLLEATSITKVRIYIWTEGQDIDCTNSVSSGTANISFSFGTYDVELVGETYEPIEKFNTITVANNTGVTYAWSAANTNLSVSKISDTYQFRISKIIDEIPTIIRSFITTVTTIDVNQLTGFSSGEYFVEVKALSEEFSNSDYSSSITFQYLTTPTIPGNIENSVVSWLPVLNPVSYTVRAFDESSGMYYTANTTSLSLNLSTTMFNGSVLLTSGKTYQISVRANGGLGFANSNYSDYSDNTSWTKP